MSETNLSEKISDSITNVIKKTKLFDKLHNIEFYFGSFFIVSSIVGITSIVMNYSNSKQIKKNQESIKLLKQTIVENNKEMLIIIKQLNDGERIINLEKTLVSSLDNQLITLNQIKNLPLLSMGKIDKLSRSTSISSNLLESPLNKVNQLNLDEEWYVSEQHNKKEEDEDILNDCYDAMPLSNVKKAIVFKGWFT